MVSHPNGYVPQHLEYIHPWQAAQRVGFPIIKFSSDLQLILRDKLDGVPECRSYIGARSAIPT